MSSVKHLSNYFKALLNKEENQEHTLYAIVDSAINKDFTKALHMQEENSYNILLKEPLAQKVEKAAPYLVKLNLEEEYTQKLMQKGFATNWLTYILSDKNLNELTQELKEMIMPYSEQHQREILFRFYDPRNLDNYLMIHNEEELEEMFEDVGGRLFTVDTISNNLLNYYSKESINDFVDLEEF
jgi:uncharacterized membrane protein YheB (UPF0754 family)